MPLRYVKENKVGQRAVKRPDNAAEISRKRNMDSPGAVYSSHNNFKFKFEQITAKKSTEISQVQIRFSVIKHLPI